MKRKILLTGLFVMLVAGVLAIAKRDQIVSLFVKSGPGAKPIIIAPAPKYDPVLLVKLLRIIGTFDGHHPAYTMVGNLTVTNHADSTEKMDHVPFVISKNRDYFYYKMGLSETICGSSMYLNINPDSKKVFITPNNQSQTMKLIDVEQLVRLLQTEEYEMKDIHRGNLETISLLNEKHYTCKEYTITYDTLKHQLVNVYYRLPYIREPMNRSKEKVIDIKLTQCDTVADVSNYPAIKSIINVSGKLTEKYSGYTLIHL